MHSSMMFQADVMGAGSQEDGQSLGMGVTSKVNSWHPATCSYGRNSPEEACLGHSLIFVLGQLATSQTCRHQNPTLAAAKRMQNTTRSCHIGMAAAAVPPHSTRRCASSH